MNARRDENLKAEELEARVAPTLVEFNDPGHSGDRRTNPWKRGITVVPDPVVSPDPTGPMPTDPYEPIL